MMPSCNSISRGEIMRRTILLSILATAVLMGCNVTYQQMETTYLPHNDARPQKVFARQSAQACSHRILFFIPVGDNSVNKAVGNLTHYHPRVDNLLGVQVEQTWGFWLLGQTVCTRVSAYPVAYTDAGPHWQPFDMGKMEGTGEASQAGGSTAVATTPPTPSTPVTSVTSESTPPGTTDLPPRTVEPRTTYTPPPKPPEDPKPTQADCDRMCGRTAGFYEGSSVVQSTIRRQCVDKCLTPEKKAYRMCIEKAQNWDQVKACNKL